MRPATKGRILGSSTHADLFFRGAFPPGQEEVAEFLDAGFPMVRISAARIGRPGHAGMRRTEAARGLEKLV